MASNIKLGARPKNFVRTVTFALPEGGEGRIACTYRYRTRTQFGEFVDALIAKSPVGRPDYTDPADVHHDEVAKVGPKIVIARSRDNAAGSLAARRVLHATCSARAPRTIF